MICANKTKFGDEIMGAKQIEPLSIYTMATIIAAREQAKHKHCNFCYDGNFIKSSIDGVFVKKSDLEE